MMCCDTGGGGRGGRHRRDVRRLLRQERIHQGDQSE